MIQLSSAGKRYGHKLLFEDADWLITPESRIGLVGANGTGKSTVMKILGGLETLDYGSISRTRGISAGYLPQDGLTLSGRSIFAECMSVFDDLHAMEKEMESLAHNMSEFDHLSQEYAAVADRYQKLEHEFRARDGYTLEAEVGKVLTGLGFQRDDWTAPDRRIFRRLANAHRPRQTPPAKAQPAPARRAHQSSRPRSPQLAGGLSRPAIRTPLS